MGCAGALSRLLPVCLLGNAAGLIPACAEHLRYQRGSRRTPQPEPRAGHGLGGCRPPVYPRMGLKHQRLDPAELKVPLVPRVSAADPGGDSGENGMLVYF